MKKLFKMLSFLLICTLTISLIGCTKKKDDDKQPDEGEVKNAELVTALEEVNSTDNCNYTITVDTNMTFAMMGGYSVTTTSIIEYQDGKSKTSTLSDGTVISTVYTESVVEGSTIKIYTYTYVDGAWSKYEAPNYEVNEILDYDVLNPDKFTYENGKYVINDVTVVDTADIKMTYDRVEITLVNGHISGIYFVGEMKTSELDCELEITCTLSKHGSTIVTLPTV